MGSSLDVCVLGVRGEGGNRVTGFEVGENQRCLLRIKELATQLAVGLLSRARGDDAAGDIDRLLDDGKADACDGECEEAVCPRCGQEAERF